MAAISILDFAWVAAPHRRVVPSLGPNADDERGHAHVRLRAPDLGAVHQVDHAHSAGQTREIRRIDRKK